MNIEPRKFTEEITLNTSTGRVLQPQHGTLTRPLWYGYKRGTLNTAERNKAKLSDRPCS